MKMCSLILQPIILHTNRTTSIEGGLPLVSFDAFFGGTTFSKKILSGLPKEIIIRDRTGYGVSRYKVSQELIWEESERRELQKVFGE